MAERTPFLADNDHNDDYDGRESHITKKSPANAHFKGPIKILTIVISFLCLTVFGLLITSYVLLQLGSFNYTYSAEAGIRDLSICVSTSSLSRLVLPQFMAILHHLHAKKDTDSNAGVVNGKLHPLSANRIYPTPNPHYHSR
jgi:hypothetical protein